MTESILTKLKPDQSIVTTLTHAHSIDLQNVIRWVVASSGKYFEDFFRSQRIPFYYEGAHRKTDDEFRYVEYRFNGPNVNQLSKTYYAFDFHINILWSVLIGKDNLYEPQRIIGLITVAMKNICVYKYGNDPIHDDDSFVDTLLIQSPIIVNNFGIIRPDVNLMQGTVEVPYKMSLQIS